MQAVKRLFLALCLFGLPLGDLAQARVERIEILSRTNFAEGISFGDAGPYEKLRGRVWFALDPGAPANTAIADLKLAPRDEGGLVTFASDFLMLRPAKGAGNDTLLYEVNNRGNIAILGQIDDAAFTNDPTTAADAGNGFLFRHGFSLLWSAWATDVASDPTDHRMILHAPIATQGDAPITGRVAYEFLVDSPTETAGFTGILGTAYPHAVEGAPDAVLTERDRPDGLRRAIPRTEWSFVVSPSGGTPRRIKLAAGFRTGRIYELVYTAKDPTVVALGMAGIRDLLSYLGNHGLAEAPPPRHRLIFGISQSGRLIQTMLLRGLALDEAGQLAFDGAFIHVAGGGKGGFDYRFAMPTRHASMLEDHIYPTDFFPFTTIGETDPVTGTTGSVLDRERATGHVPKLFLVNDSSEYWNRAASLIATDPEGQRDIPPAPEARIYLIAGAQHYVGRQATRNKFANCVNTLNHYPVLRALLLSLQGWVADGKPPPSTYPRVADGTLISVAHYKEMFPNMPGFRLPEDALRPPQLDFGPRFDTERIADIVPPLLGAPFTTLVPKPDADGLDQGGIEMPEMLAPLGTRTGFNTRSEAAGFPWATARWDGSFIPFARNEAERRAAGDPRPSLDERYSSRGDYESRVRSAAAHVVAQGFLLPEDVDQLTEAAGGLYDRIMTHDPADRSCGYLFGPQ